MEGRCGRQGRDETNIKEIACVGMWTSSVLYKAGYESVAITREHSYEISGSIRAGKFIDQPSDNQLLCRMELVIRSHLIRI
jgi:hypothetical protein